MSDTSNLERSSRFRAIIHIFLKGRLDTKLEKLAADDPKRVELIAQYQPAVWLNDAARRVKQIQAVTHSLKAIHPDARGTNLYVLPERLTQHLDMGSHVLGRSFAGDVVGNAAALDVYKFLKLEVDGRNLLDWLQAKEDDILHALSDEENEAQQWCAAFTALTQPTDIPIASHTLAKQILLAGRPRPHQ